MVLQIITVVLLVVLVQQKGALLSGNLYDEGYMEDEMYDEKMDEGADAWLDDTMEEEEGESSSEGEEEEQNTSEGATETSSSVGGTNCTATADTTDVDPGCSDPEPECDESTDTCVECLHDDACFRNTPGYPICVGTVCMQCRDSVDCHKGTIETSDDHPNGPTCITDTSTPDSIKRCASPACDTHADCTNPSAPACDGTTGICVECFTGNDCSASEPRCNSLLDMCVACVSDSDCPTFFPGTFVCQGAGGNNSKCIECDFSTPCTDPSKTCNADGECV